MNSTATPPLVSVVTRTMGRPELSRALASIAGQGYRPLEIVLVDAGATGIAMKQHAGIPVRMVTGGPYDRPRAANAGLKATRGAWIVFLDEDDEIAPNHIAQLLATATVAGLPVAYSQTQLVDANGPGRIFGGPFNREALLRSNYLTIHSVLFHRSLLADARFDEELTTFEDWDFWLQLSSRTPFAFSGTPTAIYQAAAGASGAGSGANLDRDAVLAQREKLMRKWAPR
ncbi:MAG: glycosyltransferase [Usitatibacter sp.]